MTEIRCGSLTDVGRVRKENQDSATVLGPQALGGPIEALLVVADGMGGHRGGGIASRIAVDTVLDTVRSSVPADSGPEMLEELANALSRALKAANSAVWREGVERPELRGMGTTCVAAALCRGAAVVGNVGDSRIYMLRDRALTQLSQDHSLVQEYVRAGEMSAAQARQSRFRNVITRAIGIRHDVEPDVEVVELREGDTLLLCTDGLTNMVSDREIARLLAVDAEVDATCRLLVDAALQAGGDDNVTVAVARSGAFVAYEPLAPPSPSSDGLAEEDEGYETDLDLAVSASSRAAAGQGGRWAVAMLVCLVVALGGALAWYAARYYALAAAPRPQGAARPLAPARDFGALTYEAPVLLLAKPVRGAMLACDPAGNAFVVTLTGKTLRVDPNGAASQPIPAPLPPEQPAAEAYLAADGQGYLYVSVRAERCILRYDASGTRRGVIGAGHLTRPEAVAVDGEGNVLVVDGNRLKVLKARTPRAGFGGGLDGTG